MSWVFWDRIRALFARNNLYQADQLLSNQTDLGRITTSGDVLNQSTVAGLLEQTNLQINRMERYKDFDQMDEVGEIFLSLDLYADEGSLTDPERKHTIFIKSKTKKIKDELEDFFYNTLLIDNELRSIIRYLCKYGDIAFEIVPTVNRDGVARIRNLNIYNFTRIETRMGDLVGFFYQDQYVTSPMFYHPWQIMHTRLTSYENIYHPYGRSILDGGRKAFKQLRLMEDAAIVYRLTRAPEKRVFTIPVGNIPPREVPNYIEIISRAVKRKKIFENANGDVTERWSPHIQEDDFWLPQRADGTGPKVDTLPGAENLDQIADIEYFKKKMISALKIPFSRVGMGDSGDDSKQSLSQVAPEFAKAVQWIQRAVGTSLKKIALVHLAAKGYDIEDMKSFDIGMTASSAIDELYRIETWKARVDVMKGLKDLGYFPPDWIISRFTDLSVEEIQLIDEMRKSAVIPSGEEGGEEGVDDLGLGDLFGPGEGEGVGAQTPEVPLEDIKNKMEQLLTERIQHSRETFSNLITEIRKLGGLDDIVTSTSWLLSRNELDGLQYNVTKDGQVISESIESKIPKEERELAIATALNLHVTEREEAIKNNNVSENITENDLPI